MSKSIKNTIAQSSTITRTPEQQAAIDQLRAEKVEAKIEQLQATLDKPEQPLAASVAPATATEQAMHIAAAVQEAVMKLFGFGEDDGGPSWKRKLAAFFASALLASGAGYVIGTLAGYAMVGIAALGGSVLWAYLILIVALILSFYAGLKIGQHVGNYVLSGQVDRDIVAAKNKITGWFSSAKEMVTSKPLVTVDA